MKHISMTRRKKLMGGRKPSSAASETPHRTPAIELFIDRGLHALYDRVVAEPIPEEWLRLIEEDRRTVQARPSDGDQPDGRQLDGRQLDSGQPDGDEPVGGGLRPNQSET